MNLIFHASPAKVATPGFVRSILELLGIGGANCRR
jgi:hypothetical protein